MGRVELCICWIYVYIYMCTYSLFLFINKQCQRVEMVQLLRLDSPLSEDLSYSS